MTNFRDKLKEIRASEAERARQRIPLTDHQLGLDQPAERFLAARGELVKELERLMNEFIAESPMFEVGHGFFEGKYVLSLSYDEPLLEEGRGMRKHFTRINFLLDPCAADGRFSITKRQALTVPPARSISLRAAPIVPPVASRSSTRAIRSPLATASSCISSESLPYSSA